LRETGLDRGCPSRSSLAGNRPSGFSSNVRALIPAAAGAAAPRSHDLGDAEIRDLDAPLFVQQHVFRFDVPMHDALLVGELKRLTDLRHDGQRLLRLDMPFTQQVAQGHPVHVFHQQEEHPARLAKVVNGDDVRMTQPGQGLGLALKAFCELRLGALLRRENLQGHQAVELRLACLVHHAHAAAAEALEDLELGETRGDLVGRRHGFHDLCSMRPRLHGCFRLRGQADPHDAARAQSLGRLGGQSRAAARTRARRAGCCGRRTGLARAALDDGQDRQDKRHIGSHDECDDRQHNELFPYSDPHRRQHVHLHTLVTTGLECQGYSAPAVRQ